MKILYVTTVGETMDFFKTFAEELIKEGHTLDIATNETGSKVADCYKEWKCNVYPIDCCRSPFNSGNFNAIRQIKKIVEENHYDIVHCHTPIAAMCTRLACLKVRRSGQTKVIYTAHGFHFYKGAPQKNWMIYYPVEKICSHFTDVLVTINHEDYRFAKRHMSSQSVVYVPGVGIDLKFFGKQGIDRNKKRQELGIPEDALLLLSVGELNENKNHETVIRAIAEMEGVYYIIAGKGELQEHLQNIIAELSLGERVKLLGYRNDIGDLHLISDVYILPSFREGLNVSIMEAMASGLPVACSRIRGNTDLIDDKGGALFDPNSVNECRNNIMNLLAKDYASMGKYNLEKINQFEINHVNMLMKKIYKI